MIGCARAAQIARLIGLACLVPALMGVERPPGLGDVQEVRTWSYEDYTRVVVELTTEIPLEPESAVRLAANARAGSDGVTMRASRSGMVCSTECGSGRTRCATRGS